MATEKATTVNTQSKSKSITVVITSIPAPASYLRAGEKLMASLQQTQQPTPKTK